MVKKANNSNRFYISSSKIHGKGVHAAKNLSKNEDIDVGIDFYGGVIPYVTEDFGSWINHGYKPNSYLRYKNGKWYVTASTSIPADQEILLDYRKTPWYIEGPKSHYT